MSPTSSGSSARNVMVPVIVVVIAAVALGFALVSASGGDDDGQGSSSAQAASGNGEETESTERRDEADPLAMGDVDAPVVMVNYSDFQCPYCGKFARDSQPELVKDYVDEGILRIEWRDFPYFGDESKVSAVAARAAAEQDKFWEFHDEMYADQPEMNSGKIDTEYLTDIAEDIDLDVDQFKADLESDEFQDQVEEDFTEGQQIGVTGTPTFVINGTQIVGAQPLNTFTDVIENEAREAE